MKEKPISIGIDVGGSHISCAAVDRVQGKIIEESITREKVDNTAAADAILGIWANTLARAISRIEVDRLAGFGFAIPGPFDYRNGVSKMKHKFQNLYDLKISNALHPLLPLPDRLPMRFLNDATSFAVGEAWLGKGKAYRKVLAITLGTGFGSAFVDGGVPVVERKDVPKEGCLWYLPYREGIADEYFTTRWFVKTFKEKTGKEVSGAKDIARLAEASDPVAMDIFEKYGKEMARFLAPWLRRFGADILVIGGNISGAYPLFGPALGKALEEENIKLNIELSELMEDAAMIGSARLLDEGFWKKVSAQLPSI